MIISREFENKYFDKKSVVTVGTFDGVHLGHRKIIEDVIKIKSQKKLRSVIVTFDPHPQLVLKNKHKEICKAGVKLKFEAFVPACYFPYGFKACGLGF